MAFLVTIRKSPSLHLRALDRSMLLGVRMLHYYVIAAVGNTLFRWAPEHIIYEFQWIPTSIYIFTKSKVLEFSCNELLCKLSPVQYNYSIDNQLFHIYSVFIKYTVDFRLSSLMWLKDRLDNKKKWSSINLTFSSIPLKTYTKNTSIFNLLMQAGNL